MYVANVPVYSTMWTLIINFLNIGCATPSTEMEEMNTVTSASAEHSQGRSTQEVQHVPTTQVYSTYIG